MAIISESVEVICHFKAKLSKSQHKEQKIIEIVLSNFVVKIWVIEEIWILQGGLIEVVVIK